MIFVLLTLNRPRLKAILLNLSKSKLMSTLQPSKNNSGNNKNNKSINNNNINNNNNNDNIKSNNNNNNNNNKVVADQFHNKITAQHNFLVQIDFFNV